MNYLYNGVELPELPKTTFSHAFIHKTGGKQQLWIGEEITYNGGNIGIDGAYLHYFCSNGEWEELSGGTDAMVCGITSVEWANFDVLNEDGSVFLAASDPLPVGTPITDPVSFTMGYQLGCRLRAQRAVREPIGYSYNGTVLPALPEWDKNERPCAVLFSTNVSAYLHVGTSLVYRTTESGNRQYGLTNALISACSVKSIEKGWDEFWDDPLENGVDWIGMVGNDVHHWSNTDILYEDGTVWITASDPVPVYGGDS